jgi:Tat protein translocase TatC
MTFGEHLEDLRRRIIYSLVYITLGVVITMAYGENLLEWTLVPHYKAIRGADWDRAVARMGKNMRRLGELTSATSLAPEAGAKKLIETPIHWEALFIRDVALPHLETRLAQPFSAFSEKLEAAVPSIPPSERARLAADLDGLGRELAKAIASEFASELEVASASDIPGRFVELEKLLRRIDVETGRNELKRAIGWGEDIGPVLQSLREFIGFLELRRKEVLKGEIPLSVLTARLEETDLPRVLKEMLALLEKDATALVEGKAKSPMALTYMENFSSYLKVAVIFGIFLALPFVLYEMWKFIGAGLYPHEQKYVVTLLPFSLALFLIGALFGYLGLIPVGLEFLAGWGIEDVELNITLGSYVGLFFTLTLILGLVFQTPLVMIFLAKIGVVDVNGFRKARRVAIFAGVCLAVVLTPPDPFSWSLMAAPMILLYEVGILACKLIERRKPPAAT